MPFKMAYVCVVCGPVDRSCVGNPMAIVHTDHVGWRTRGILCSSCVRISWRDHAKLEPKPKSLVELDMQCKEYTARLTDEFARRWNIPTESLWIGY